MDGWRHAPPLANPPLSLPAVVSPGGPELLRRRCIEDSACSDEQYLAQCLASHVIVTDKARSRCQALIEQYPQPSWWPW